MFWRLSAAERCGAQGGQTKRDKGERERGRGGSAHAGWVGGFAWWLGVEGWD